MKQPSTSTETDKPREPKAEIPPKASTDDQPAATAPPLTTKAPTAAPNKAPTAPPKPRGVTDDLSQAAPTSSPEAGTEDKRIETNLVTRENILRAMQSEFVYGDETVKSQAGTLLIIIQGAMERYYTKDGLSLVLGRRSDAGHVDVDLTPYGGLQRGVSRLHARLHVEDGELYITDLDSSNGSFLDGERLMPHKPKKVIKRYSLLVLGSLSIQISYRKP